MPCLSLVGSLVALLTLASVSVAERFTALQSDGKFITAEAVDGWNNPNAQPQLAGQPIFHPERPLRSLVDQTITSLALPAAYVEMVGGDRLAGTVLAWQSGTELLYEVQPDYLVVRPSFEFHDPQHPYQSAVRVRTDWLRRIVWEHQTDRIYQPSHAFLRDGRQVRFRSLRWNEAAVMLLVDQEIVTLPFADLAEVHLPEQPFWDAYFEQLAILTPRCDARLIRLQAIDGSQLTTSTERFQALHHGNAGKPENWLQLLQPAWSLDPLWLRYPTIRSWIFFEPHQVPLSFLPPSAVQHEPRFGAAWRWQHDQSVEATPLRSGDETYGWGLGVHGQTRLEFSLPAEARAFRTRIGLDHIAGSGGCVRASILLADSGEKKLYESAVLIGSQHVVDSGRIDVSHSAPDARLILAVDALDVERPQGADPFDIRDALDWLAPELELDPEQVRTRVAEYRLRVLPALRGWRVSQSKEPSLTRNDWVSQNPENSRYQLRLVSAMPFTSYSQTLPVAPADRWLALFISRPPNVPASRVQVRVDGRTLGEIEVPQQSGSTVPDPILVPIEEGEQKAASVEVVHLPSEPEAYLAWQGVQFVSQQPGLLKIFDDEKEFAANLTEGMGRAVVFEDESAAGKIALRVEQGTKASRRLPELQAAIRERPAHGEYRFIRFAWRKQEGKLIGLGLAHQGELGIGTGLQRQDAWNLRPFRPDYRGAQQGYRYFAGQGDFEDRIGLRVDGSAPHDKWNVVTRDLFGDFGTFTLTGLELLCPEGEAAFFDQIYLGRTAEDFQHLTHTLEPTAEAAPEDPNILRRANERWTRGPVVAELAPQFALDDAGGEVQLLREFRGQSNVLRTLPPGPGKAAILRSTVSIPAENPPSLRMTVSHDEQEDWQLIVKANGETVHDSLVNQESSEQGWREITVDLTKFAGENVILEVHNHANHWPHEAAYWSRLEVAP